MSYSHLRRIVANPGDFDLDPTSQRNAGAGTPAYSAGHVCADPCSIV